MKIPTINRLLCSAAILLGGGNSASAGPPCTHPGPCSAICDRYVVLSADYRLKHGVNEDHARVCAPRVETVLIEQKLNVAKPVVETVCEKRSRTICVPVCHPIEKDFSTLEYREKTVYQSVLIESGQWEVTYHQLSPCEPPICTSVWVPCVVEKRVARSELVPVVNPDRIWTVACESVAERVTVEVKRPEYRTEHEEVAWHAPVDRVCKVQEETVARVSDVVVEKVQCAKVVEVRLCEPAPPPCCPSHPHPGSFHHH